MNYVLRMWFQREANLHIQCARNKCQFCDTFYMLTLEWLVSEDLAVVPVTAILVSIVTEVHKQRRIYSIVWGVLSFSFDNGKYI